MFRARNDCRPDPEHLCLRAAALIDGNYDGEAAGLASAGEGLAIPPAGLASAAGLAASDGEASDELLPCCLLQAIAAKNIDMRARIRTLRIPPPSFAQANTRASAIRHNTLRGRATQAMTSGHSRQVRQRAEVYSFRQKLLSGDIRRFLIIPAKEYTMAAIDSYGGWACGGG